MMIKISDWLISQAKQYPPNSPALRIYVYYSLLGYQPTTQHVTLYYIYVDSSTGNIKAAWVFTDYTNYQLNSTPIGSLLRLDTGQAVITFGQPDNSTALIIPSSYTWGQVILVEVISISGAN